jgi:hypothetical protein
MQGAIMASGVLVSMAEGVIDDPEIHALQKELRSVRFAHPSPFIQQLADLPELNTRRRPGATYEEYRDSGLETIRSAVEILGRKAPAELAAFQQVLVRIAEIVADANREGDVFGVGARRRTPNETAAIEEVRRAAGLPPS